MWNDQSPLMTDQWGNGSFPNAPLSFLPDHTGQESPSNLSAALGSLNLGAAHNEELAGLAHAELFEALDLDWNNFSAFNLTQSLWHFKNSRNSTKDVFKQVVDNLNIYFTPVIITVGLIGNTMSLLVFSLTHLQRLSSSFYLSSLAMADLGFLLGISIVWLERVNVPLYSKEGWCQGVHYLTKVCGFLAMWNVVSFTAERYIIVYHPLRKDTFCTKRKARIVVLCLVIFALSLYSYTVWIYDVVQVFNQKGCSPLFQYYDIMTIISSVDTLFACVIPSLLIVVLNVRIMIKIHHYQTRRTETSRDLVLPSAACDNHRRRSVIHTSISTTGSMHIKFSSSRLPERNSTSQWQEVLGITPPGSKKKVLRGQSQFRTARMLLILSSVFVLLNLPSHAFRVQAFVSRVSGGSLKAPADKFKWQEFFEIMYFLNFAINFFIYSACGRQFRTGLRRLCRRWKYKIQKCGKLIQLGRHFTASQQERVDRLSAEGYNLKVRPIHQ